jgi:hypothetical protein
MGNVGRIWHRMYPRYILENKQLKKTRGFVEILTIFPDDSETTRDFLDYLESSRKFEKIW